MTFSIPVMFFSASVTQTFQYDIYDFIELITTNIFFASKTEISRMTLQNDNYFLSFYLLICNTSIPLILQSIDPIIRLQSITLFMFPILLLPKLKPMPSS